MEESGQLDIDAFNEMGILYDSIINTLRTKGASKRVIDKTWHTIGCSMTIYALNSSKRTADGIFKELRQMNHDLQLADEEQVRKMYIFLPYFKKPNLSHLLFEEGGGLLRNVDDYTIGRIAQ